MIKRRYSRLSRIEERKSLRSILIFGVLSLFFVAFMFFFGLQFAIRFSTIVTDFIKDKPQVEQNDNTPPAPPRPQVVPGATSKTNLEVSGTAEPGVTVVLFLNGEKTETITGEGGEFSFILDLLKGSNQFTLKAVDAAGNESQETKKYVITFDNKPPILTISSPESGAELFGNDQRQLTIKGETEEGVDLNINERLVVVQEGGLFTFATTLNDGENSFSIIAIDEAGNKTEESLTVNFTP